MEDIQKAVCQCLWAAKPEFCPGISSFQNGGKRCVQRNGDLCWKVKTSDAPGLSTLVNSYLKYCLLISVQLSNR